MILHPFDLCTGIQVTAEVRRDADSFIFDYMLLGNTSDLVIPPPATGTRTDGLWQATCFEAFIAVGRSSYIELNFAPSGQWAAYQFSDYRQGMRELEILPPDIRFAEDRLEARVEVPAAPGAALGLSAVLEHMDGTRTYWALAHPGGNRPDFHARGCFIARLP